LTVSIETLRRAIRGTVIATGEAGYDEARGGLLFNRRNPDRKPQIIVRAAAVEDVQATVRFAALNGLKVSPRGSGHNFSGIALQDGIVLDLGALDRIAIDAEARIAEVEPAARNGTLATALAARGLAFPVGHCHTVALSGYLLGGGFGWNSGAWGLACHNVEAVEVVMADGRLIRASEGEHPDVFWAVRGGGPEFFGVVVCYRLRLQALPQAIRTSLFFYPIERVREVEAWVTAAMAMAPATVEFAVQMQSAPPFVPAGKVVVGLPTVFAESEEEARAVLGRIAALAPAGALAVEENLAMSFEALYAATAASFYAGERYAVDTMWSADAGSLFEGLAAAIAEAPSPAAFALGVVLPPAAAEAGLPGAAFSMAGPAFGAAYAIWDEPAADAANVEWLRATADRLAPVTHGRYVGEADLARPGWLEACYAPAALGRLRALAALHDPLGLFRRSAERPEPARLAG
jgi:FAD/FMN-containing dehydrogenase